jgi:hypothetical protein
VAKNKKAVQTADTDDPESMEAFLTSVEELLLVGANDKGDKCIDSKSGASGGSRSDSDAEEASDSTVLVDGANTCTPTPVEELLMVLAAAANEGTKVRRYEGTKVRRYEGSKVRRYEGTKVRRYEGTKVRRYEGTTVGDKQDVSI